MSFVDWSDVIVHQMLGGMSRVRGAESRAQEIISEEVAHRLDCTFSGLQGAEFLDCTFILTHTIVSNLGCLPGIPGSFGGVSCSHVLMIRSFCSLRTTRQH